MKENWLDKIITSGYTIIFMIVFWIVSICYFNIKIVNYIEEKGLKSILEEVWEGKK